MGVSSYDGLLVARGRARAGVLVTSEESGGNRRADGGLV
jgi:hypothetical protein